VNFSRTGALIRHLSVRLPDVFAADWPERAALQAVDSCAPLARERQLIGWITDDDLGWAQPQPAAEGEVSPPTLLQICLSLEPSFAAYHSAWEFVLALHGGQLAAVARAWGVPLANREGVRELTRAERGLTSRGYRRDCARWSREFARRYFAGTAAAIRAADPHHLVLGARARGPLGETIRRGVDLSGNRCRAAWTPRRLRPPPAVSAGPVLVDGFCWVERNFAAVPPGSGRARRLTTLERMLAGDGCRSSAWPRHPPWSAMHGGSGAINPASSRRSPAAWSTPTASKPASTRNCWPTSTPAPIPCAARRIRAAETLTP
jgi:agarase